MKQTTRTNLEAKRLNADTRSLNPAQKLECAAANIVRAAHAQCDEAADNAALEAAAWLISYVEDSGNLGRKRRG